MNGATLVVAALFSVAMVAITRFAFRPSASPRLPDALVSAVLDVLPGGNCGACGNASCFDAASRIVTGELLASACVTGGEKTAAAVSVALHPGRMR